VAGIVKREVEEKRKVIVVWDVAYDYAIPLIKESVKSVMKEDGHSLIWSTLSTASHKTEEAQAQCIGSSQARMVTLPQGSTLSNYHILYIGPQESLCLTHLLISTGSTQFSVYDPEKGGEEACSPSSVSKLLSRRYFLVQKARDAERIGIVVGTLGVGECPFLLFAHEAHRTHRTQDTQKKPN
jgi:diphthamide biosynthesis protein 2